MTALNWRQTWPDTPNNFIGEHPDKPGRVARVVMHPDERTWFWYVNDPALKIAEGTATKMEDAIAGAERAFWK